MANVMTDTEIQDVIKGILEHPDHAAPWFNYRKSGRGATKTAERIIEALLTVARRDLETAETAYEVDNAED